MLAMKETLSPNVRTTGRPAHNSRWIHEDNDRTGVTGLRIGVFTNIVGGLFEEEFGQPVLWALLESNQ